MATLYVATTLVKVQEPQPHLRGPCHLTGCGSSCAAGTMDIPTGAVYKHYLRVVSWRSLDVGVVLGG